MTRLPPVLAYRTRAARGPSWPALAWATLTVSLCQIFPLGLAIAISDRRGNDEGLIFSMLGGFVLAATGLGLAAADRSDVLPAPVCGALLFNAAALLLVMSCVFVGS